MRKSQHIAKILKKAARSGTLDEKLLEGMAEEEKKLLLDLQKSGMLRDAHEMLQGLNIGHELNEVKNRLNMPTSNGPIPIYSLLKYAACVLMTVLAAAYLYFNIQESPGTIGRNGVKAQLLTADNKSFDLADEKNPALQELRNIKVAGDTLFCLRQPSDKSPGVTEPPIFTIRTPDGGRYSLVLEDGTRISLNAGSSIQFPAHFSGSKRSISISGEAYLEVSHDKRHPFVVNSGKMQIEVLGTKFNLSNYADQVSANVALLQGSVRVTNTVSKEATLIKPGTMASLEPSGNISTIDIDLANIANWKEGALVYRDMPFSELIKKLQRHYNIQIRNQDERLNTKRFSGYLTDDNIQDVMSYFKEIYGLNYRMENDVLLITK